MLDATLNKELIFALLCLVNVEMVRVKPNAMTNIDPRIEIISIERIAHTVNVFVILIY